MNTDMPHKPSTAFIAASWVALLLGAAAYLIGLFLMGIYLAQRNLNKRLRT